MGGAVLDGGKRHREAHQWEGSLYGFHQRALRRAVRKKRLNQRPGEAGMPWRAQGAVLQHNQPLQRNSRGGSQSVLRGGEGSHRLQHHGQIQRWPVKDAALPCGRSPSNFQFLGQPSLTQLLYPALYPLLHQPRDPGRLRPLGPRTFRQPSSWHSPCLPSHQECCKRETQECGALPGLVSGHSQLRLPSPPSLPLCVGPQTGGRLALPVPLPPFPVPRVPSSCPSQACLNSARQCHCQSGGDQALYPKLQQPPSLVLRNFSLDSVSLQTRLGKQPPRICSQQKVNVLPLFCLYCLLLGKG